MRCYIQSSLFVLLLLFCSRPIAGQGTIKSINNTKQITTFHNYENGFLLYGSLQGEIGVFDGIQFQPIDNINARINKFITVKDQIFILSSKGIYKLENASVNQWSGNHIDALDATNDLKILITSSGVMHRSGDSYSPDTKEFYNYNTIKQGHIFENDNLTYIQIDQKLFKKDKSWKEVLLFNDSSATGILLNQDFIYADSSAIVSFDPNRYIDSLITFSNPSFAQVFENSKSNILVLQDHSLQEYNLSKKRAGKSIEIDVEHILDHSMDDWGSHWFISEDKIIQYIPESIKLDPLPKLEITDVLIDGKAVNSIKSAIKIDNNNFDIKVQYEGCHLIYPQELYFQHKVIADNSNNYSTSLGDWSKPSKKREFEIRNLQNGNYEILVRTSVDGTYHKISDPIKVKINNNNLFYLWLLAISAGILIILLSLYFNYRYNVLKEKTEKERRALIQKNELLNLQQKALQLQMNPHFLFNSLNSIQGLIATNENQKARKYLREFSLLMRGILNQSRKSEISIEEETKYLNNYLSLEMMANNDKFQYEIDHSDDVDDQWMIPNMIIQPFVENAILHGLKGRETGNITIKFYIEDAILICSVEDDGVGRQASFKKKGENHESVAVELTNNRLNKRFVNPIQYEDLFDKKGNALGTRVIIKLIRV